MEQVIHNRGRKRLMLRLPHLRTELALTCSPAFVDICESYELAAVAREAFSRKAEHQHLVTEYDELCAHLEKEAEREFRKR